MTALENVIEGPVGVKGEKRADAVARATELLVAMRRLAEGGLTMVVVTHEISFAREAADRVIFMDDGVVVEQGRPEQVIDDPQHERTRAFLARFR
jgi:polar amino acid transport system ATP-binding protein